MRAFRRSCSNEDPYDNSKAIGRESTLMALALSYYFSLQVRQPAMFQLALILLAQIPDTLNFTPNRVYHDRTPISFCLRREADLTMIECPSVAATNYQGDKSTKNVGTRHSLGKLLALMKAPRTLRSISRLELKR